MIRGVFIFVRSFLFMFAVIFNTFCRGASCKKSCCQRPRFAGKNYAGLLAWIEKYALLVDPAPPGKQRLRDAKDDFFLACALSARASSIVSNDQDLLTLGKPFGIEILRPAQFIARHKL